MGFVDLVHQVQLTRFSDLRYIQGFPGYQCRDRVHMMYNILLLNLPEKYQIHCKFLTEMPEIPLFQVGDE